MAEDIVEAVKLAVQQITDDPDITSFSKADIANRVLAVHPELDRARLDRMIDYAWGHDLDPRGFNEAEQQAGRSGTFPDEKEK
jgi:hypothetical protein